MPEINEIPDLDISVQTPYGELFNDQLVRAINIKEIQENKSLNKFSITSQGIICNEVIEFPIIENGLSDPTFLDIDSSITSRYCLVTKNDQSINVLANDEDGYSYVVVSFKNGQGLQRDHKYYLSMMVSYSHDLIKEIAIQYYFLSGGTSLLQLINDGKFHKISDIIFFQANTTVAPDVFLFKIIFGKNGSSITIKEPLSIDLTEAFGEGNEPDLAWCDENISFIT